MMVPTYNEQQLNRSKSTTRCPRRTFSFRSVGIGSAKMMISSAMLQAASRIIMSSRSMHVLFGTNAQDALTGLHRKMSRKTKTTPLVTFHAINTQLAVAILLFGNTRI